MIHDEADESFIGHLFRWLFSAKLASLTISNAWVLYRLSCRAYSNPRNIKDLSDL